MLTIRKEQMDVFRERGLRTFEDDMVVHLQGFTTPLFDAAGEGQVRQAIRMGVSRAAGYGFSLRGPVRLYLETMLLFGSHFDTDPQYPWAADILRDAGPQRQRARAIYERTSNFRTQVAGADGSYALQALRTLSDFARGPLVSSDDHGVESIRRELARIYPQKAAYLGAEPLQTLIVDGMEAARLHAFTSPRGELLMVLLMFAFGHGCFRDPLFPWIARTLDDPLILDADARAKRLEKKSLTWLDHVLAKVPANFP